jgi:hypothetical protein
MNANTLRKPTRKAILIGAPGKGGSFLRGVEKDIKNFCQFLKTNQGGNWSSNEIISLVMPGSAAQIANLQTEQVDYSVTYFSGHGFISDTGEQMLVIQDQIVTVQALLNGSPRQLIIVDAC